MNIKVFARKKNSLARLVTLLAATVLIGIDRLTKWLAVINLNEPGKPRSVNIININNTNILNFTYVENTGAAFSVLQGQRLFLIITTSLLVMGVLIFLLTDRLKSKLMIAALTLIVAGGAGNLIDRVFYGYVVDFIDFEIINFAIFNFADICVVTGVFLGVFATIKEEYMNYKNRNDLKKNDL
ncbi:MAG: signal peptidase II [Oscillospiraceae bacterium]|jgi:signal peptidase II|nr:signal peptidase II [Oscillospiraceae bacterium]